MVQQDQLVVHLLEQEQQRQYTICMTWRLERCATDKDNLIELTVKGADISLGCRYVHQQNGRLAVGRTLWYIQNKS